MAVQVTAVVLPASDHSWPPSRSGVWHVCGTGLGCSRLVPPGSERGNLKSQQRKSAIEVNVQA